MKPRLNVLLAIGMVYLASLLFGPGSAGGAEPAGSYGKVDAAVVKKVAWEVRTLARKLAEQGKADPETVFALLANHLWKNPELHGAAFAYAPELKNGKEVKSCPYVFRRGEQLIQTDLSASYDYTAPEQKWYAKAVKLGKAVWSDPSLAYGGGEAWIVTYSMPVYAGGKEPRFMGVVTSDVLVPASQ